MDGNPAGGSDPWGLKVTFAERAISGEGGLAALGGHTFLIIEPNNVAELEAYLGVTLDSVLSPFGFTGSKASFILGAYDFSGKLGKLVNADSDVNLEKRYKKTLTPPKYNMCLAHSTDTQFIADIIEAFIGYKDNEAYDATLGDRSFPWNFLPLPPVIPGINYTNSNAFTAGLLVAAGLKPDDVPDPMYIQPGLESPLVLPSTKGMAGKW